MHYKAFNITVELEIQSVTCPGVWLCPNGKLTIHIYLLGLCTHTSTMNPVFPLVCNEKFIFRKNFRKLKNLYELDRKLSREVVYMELIQWENCQHGNVLATFKTSLTELLYPFPRYNGVISGLDVDLLMEATRRFPGIIAPKIEISTKMTIEEVLCALKNENQNEVVVVNPKLVTSKCVPKRGTQLRQKKVCHTYRYHRAKTMKEPKCCKQKYPSQRSMSTSVESSQKMCCCRNKLPQERKYNPMYSQRSRSSSPQSTRRVCCCSKDHSLEREYVNKKVQKLRKNDFTQTCGCKKRQQKFCPLCTKYKCYFSTKCGCSFSEQNGLVCKCFQLESGTDNETEVENEVQKSAEKVISNEKEECLCSLCENSQQIKKQLTDEIHDRIQQVSSSPTNLSVNTNQNSCDEPCNEKFYKNLEKYYKQLYKRACNKVTTEKCRCGN